MRDGSSEISAYEARRPLTPDEVDRFSTAHTRCGTTFLLIVVVISILFFGLIPRAGVPFPLLFLSRIILIPVIAGVSYELVRFGASHYGNRLVRALYAPGLWLQALTTRAPDHGMLEVSIASLESTPFRDWVVGRATCIHLLDTYVLGVPGNWRMLATTANGQPAAAVFRRDEAGVLRADGLVVLTPTTSGVSRVVAFHDPALVVMFAFPEVLPP